MIIKIVFWFGFRGLNIIKRVKFTDVKVKKQVFCEKTISNGFI